MISQNDDVENAIRKIHAAGGRLVALEGAGKIPRAMESAWQSRPVPDADYFLEHSRKGHGLGLVPGALNLAVVDVDHGGDEALRHIQEKIGKPLCAVHTSAPDRFHLYYKAAGIPQGKWTNGDQCGDIRGDTGYVKLWDIGAVAAVLEAIPSAPDATEAIRAFTGTERRTPGVVNVDAQGVLYGDIWQSYGRYAMKRYRTEYKGPCPRCGGRDRFSMNPDKRLFHCRHCHAEGRGWHDILEGANLYFDVCILPVYIAALEAANGH